MVREEEGKEVSSISLERMDVAVCSEEMEVRFSTDSSESNVSLNRKSQGMKKEPVNESRMFLVMLCEEEEEEEDAVTEWRRGMKNGEE